MNDLEIRQALQTIDPATELDPVDADTMRRAAINRAAAPPPPRPSRSRLRWTALPVAVAVAATVLVALATVLLLGGASKGPLSADALAAKLRKTLAADAILHVRWRELDARGATLTTGERWEFGDRSRMITRTGGNEMETARSGVLQRWRSTDQPKLQTERMSTYEPIGTSSGWQEQLRELARDPAGWQVREVGDTIELSKPFDREGGRDVLVLRREDAVPLEIRVETPARPRFARTYRFDLVEQLEPTAENRPLLDITGAPLPDPEPAPAAPAAPQPAPQSGPMRFAPPPAAGQVEHMVEHFEIAQAEVGRDGRDTPPRTRTETWWSRDRYRRVTTDADTGRVIDEWVDAGGEIRAYQSRSDTIGVARGEVAKRFARPEPAIERGKRVRSDLKDGKLELVGRDPAAGTMTLRRIETGGDVKTYREQIVVDEATHVPIDTRTSGRSSDHDSDDPALRFPGRDFRQRMWISSYEIRDAAAFPAGVFELGPHPGAPVRAMKFP